MPGLVLGSHAVTLRPTLTILAAAPRADECCAFALGWPGEPGHDGERAFSNCIRRRALLSLRSGERLGEGRGGLAAVSANALDDRPNGGRGGRREAGDALMSPLLGAIPVENSEGRESSAPSAERVGLSGHLGI
jgi:hypothetical protein